MCHFTKKSRGFTLLEVMVSLFIFSVVLGVIFLSFKTNFTIMQSSANLKNEVDDVDHCAYYIKNEIEKSMSVITERPNWTHFDQSMGFVLSYPTVGAVLFQFIKTTRICESVSYNFAVLFCEIHVILLFVNIFYQNKSH